VSQIVRKYKGKEVSQEELDRLMPRKANWLEAPAMAANTYTEHNPLISEGCGVMKACWRNAILYVATTYKELLYWIADRFDLLAVERERTFLR
jgi:hypothetical protein